MFHNHLRRKIVLVLLAITLAAPLASAAGHRSSSPRTPEASPAPLSLMGKLWSVFTRLWQKTGCHIDPSGLCAPAPASTLSNEVDEGCHIDPSGGDTGCQIDPSGHS